MRTGFLCFSVLRVRSGPRVKLAGRKIALTRSIPSPPRPVVYSTDRSKASVPMLVFLLLCGLFYKAIWFKVFLALFSSCVFSVL